MACTCIKKINQQLAEYNTKLGIGIGVTADLGMISRLLIVTEKLDKTSKKKPALMSATYCPFCGVKFDGCAMKEPENKGYHP